ncbi:MAG: 2-oxoacid:acceptor oxidoreductase family protein [Sedimentisphaerales bacterium]|jgi:2-oxoglutarate ferredoxin oxidoreductase subunit gamma|nr:2-oxoacid:acceptor oxidoreductase family protein [Sedimentisphaerales bacterium]
MRNNSNGLYEEIIIAGFGGQGIILAGRLLAQVAMNAGKEITFMPSYGAEVRGGTANCMIIIAERKIACPVVGRPDSLIVMNRASLNKFAARLKKGGLLVTNSSMIESMPTMDETIEIISVPADELAVQLGSHKVANMIVLGAYLQRRGHLTIDAAVQALPEVIAERYHKTIPINTEALRRGAEFAFCNSVSP